MLSPNPSEKSTSIDSINHFGNHMNDHTNSSANTDPQLLLESGPMLLRDFNPKGVLRFQGRKCITCAGEIMDHWLINDLDPSIKGLYWCDRSKTRWSEGLTETVWDVPDGFGKGV